MSLTLFLTIARILLLIFGTNFMTFHVAAQNPGLCAAAGDSWIGVNLLQIGTCCLLIGAGIWIYQATKTSGEAAVEDKVTGWLGAILLPIRIVVRSIGRAIWGTPAVKP